MPSRGASVAPAGHPAGSGAGGSAAGADDRRSSRRQRGDPPGLVPPAPAGAAAASGSAAAEDLVPPSGSSPAAGALGAPPPAGAGAAAAAAAPGGTGPPAAALAPPASGALVGDPSPDFLASLRRAALVAAHAAAGVPPPPPDGEGLPPLASFALPPAAPLRSLPSSGSAAPADSSDPSYRPSRRAPVEPRDSQLSLLPDYHSTSGLRSSLLAAAAARGRSGSPLTRSATGRLPPPSASPGSGSCPWNGASSAGPPPLPGSGSGGRGGAGGGDVAGGGGVAGGGADRRAVGFSGAPARGAPVIGIPIPGGAGRLESAISTAHVARVLDGRPRLEGFELPRNLRDAGVFPQPFALGAEFHRRFPDSSRAFHEGKVLHQACAWLANANNRVADVEDHAFADGISPGAAVEALAVARTHIHQIYAILATRYQALEEQRVRPEYAHTMEDAILAAPGPGYSNPATRGFFETAAATRLSSAARDLGRAAASGRDRQSRPDRALPPWRPRGGGGHRNRTWQRDGGDRDRDGRSKRQRRDDAARGARGSRGDSPGRGERGGRGGGGGGRGRGGGRGGGGRRDAYDSA